MYNMFTKIKYLVMVLAVFANLCTLSNSSYAQDVTYADPKVLSKYTTPEETKVNWKIAQEYQKDQRYELARQHLLLALASCDSNAQRDALQRQLEIIDLKIRTMR